MKYDVALPGTNHLPGKFEWAWDLSSEETKRILVAIDELGYDTVTVSEHLAMPYFEVDRLGDYWQDALSVMAFVAGATSNVRIDTTVLVLPYHHPLRLAKAISTMDVLSGGRINLSIGVGHAEAEFAALDVPFTTRGAMTDEALAVLLELWTEKEPDCRGEFFTVSGLAFEPKPVQRPGPPIYVGGNSKPALRRAARHDGWQPNPYAAEIDELPALLDYLRSQPEYEGKDDTFDVNWMFAPSDVPVPDSFGSASAVELKDYRDQLIERYHGTFAEVGITRAGVGVPSGIASVEEFIDFLGWFAVEVIGERG
ncbi:TIGR03619 family F420-dependent LLM class oxidoreductase [Gordonia sp. NPDC127522]|uniref:TIGR03619 family F420-dependent LLM class oxidoreductase n=1 Tax=Gordonia sp. NPDC127522 TaxID=3345390 RepID=UPI003643C920